MSTKSKPWKDLPKGFLLIRKGHGDNKYQFFEGLTVKEYNKKYLESKFTKMQIREIHANICKEYLRIIRKKRQVNKEF